MTLAPFPGVELLRVRGLDDEQLRWLASLYGPVDAKYESIEFLRRQFVDNAFGWSAHVFALADGKPVGHCGVAPFPARRNGAALTAGKIEAFVVAESHRGRRDGTSLAEEVGRAAYSFAHECGVDVCFGFAPAPVSRVHERAGCTIVQLHVPSLVLVSTPGAMARQYESPIRGIVVHALAAAQNLSVAALGGVARIIAEAEPVTRRAGLGDEVLADEEPPADGSWTIEAADAWEWFTAGGVLEIIETDGRAAFRAIIRTPGADAGPLQIVSWRAKNPGVLSSLVLLDAARRLARERQAPMLRYQIWAGGDPTGSLTRTARRVGFVTRDWFDILIHADPPLNTAPVVLTPFFYVTF